MNADCWEEDSIPLETEWIQEFEKIVEERVYYPCEPMFSLCVRSIFIEKDWIVHVSTKQISLESLGSSEGGGGGGGGGYRNIWGCLDDSRREGGWMDWMKEDIEFMGCSESLELEKRRLEKRSRNFGLSDVLLFNVDMDMGSCTEGAIDNLDLILDDSGMARCFRAYSVEEWEDLGGVLNWKDSVFLFHSINTVCFVFRETPVVAIDVVDLVSGGDVSVEMPLSSILVSPDVGGVGGAGGVGGRKNKTRKVHFGFGVSSSSSSDVDSDSSSSSSEEEDEEEEGWGHGKWLKRRRRNRRKTEKRKHVLTPALIRSLFENV